MNSARIRNFVLAILAVGLDPHQSALAQSITRSEALKIAESFVHHHWESTVRNQFHGKDSSGVEVHTPDRDSGRGSPSQDCWRVNAENIGVAYKWGGVDTPATFDAGIRDGKAAGDVYTLEKRRRGKAGVSKAAVGIDCSGFIYLSLLESGEQIFNRDDRVGLPETSFHSRASTGRHHEPIEWSRSSLREMG